MGDIIKFKPKDESEIKPSFSIKKSDKYCSHKYIEIDTDERELRCTTCNAKLEAFDWVLSLAYEERGHVWKIQELERQIDVFRQEKERLEKDVANLKAAKRRII